MTLKTLVIHDGCRAQENNCHCHTRLPGPPKSAKLRAEVPRYIISPRMMIPLERPGLIRDSEESVVQGRTALQTKEMRFQLFQHLPILRLLYAGEGGLGGGVGARRRGTVWSGAASGLEAPGNIVVWRMHFLTALQL